MWDTRNTTHHHLSVPIDLVQQVNNDKYLRFHWRNFLVKMATPCSSWCNVGNVYTLLDLWDDFSLHPVRAVISWCLTRCWWVAKEDQLWSRFAHASTVTRRKFCETRSSSWKCLYEQAKGLACRVQRLGPAYNLLNDFLNPFCYVVLEKNVWPVVTCILSLVILFKF